MKLHTERVAKKRRYIHASVSASDFPGVCLELEHPLAKEELPEKNAAMFHKDEYSRTVILNQDT